MDRMVDGLALIRSARWYDTGDGYGENAVPVREIYREMEKHTQTPLVTDGTEDGNESGLLSDD